MKKLIIFGAGDIAQLAKYYFDFDSDYKVEAFTVDSEYKTSEFFEGLPVIDFKEVISKYPPSDFQMFIATSYSKLNTIRERKYNEAKRMGYSLASYVSTKCSYLSQFKYGDNCFILEDNTIQPFVRIGNNVTLWSGNHIGHHSVIEDHNFISSHVVISGHCLIKSNCFLGVNATLHNNVTVEQYNLIGAGAVITKNTNKEEVWLPGKSSLLSKKSTELGF